MILISIHPTTSDQLLTTKEELYNLKNTYRGYIRITESRIDILTNSTKPNLKLCMEIMLILNSYQMTAKFYVSESNQQINLSELEVNFEELKVYKMNSKVEKQYLKNRNFRNLEKFVIRSSHDTLDSILYSLSKLCFKHNNNLDILYDKYYLQLSQKQIAEKYNMSQVAISKKLKSNNYEMFKLIVDRI